MQIQIKSLRLRTIIGVFEWERKNKQDVIINAKVDFDGSCAAQSDQLADTYDYKSVTKKIVAAVESSQFNLIETLASEIIKILLEPPLAQKASVEIDKPQALRFADSVSVSHSAIKSDE